MLTGKDTTFFRSAMTEDLTKDSGGTRRRGQIYLDMEHVKKGSILKSWKMTRVLKKWIEAGASGKGDYRQEEVWKERASITETKKMSKCPGSGWVMKDKSNHQIWETRSYPWALLEPFWWNSRTEVWLLWIKVGAKHKDKRLRVNRGQKKRWQQFRSVSWSHVPFHLQAQPQEGLERNRCYLSMRTWLPNTIH